MQPYQPQENNQPEIIIVPHAGDNNLPSCLLQTRITPPDCMGIFDLSAWRSLHHLSLIIFARHSNDTTEYIGVRAANVFMDNQWMWVFCFHDIARILRYTGSQKGNFKNNIGDPFTSQLRFVNWASLIARDARARKANANSSAENGITIAGVAVVLNAALGTQCDLAFINRVRNMLAQHCGVNASEFIINSAQDRVRIQRMETTLVNAFISALGGQYRAVTQCPVTRPGHYPYRIDLFFPDQGVAIEIDENNHANNDPYEELNRQQHISSTLGCRFLRFVPNGPINVYEMIGRILAALQAPPIQYQQQQQQQTPVITIVDYPSTLIAAQPPIALSSLIASAAAPPATDENVHPLLKTSNDNINKKI